MSVLDQGPDIIGLGALNLDYIASASKLSSKMSDLVREPTARFEWGVESAVDEATIDRAIKNLGISSLDTSLGGSTWNTVYALANMRIGLRLAYVGVVGRVEFPGQSFVRQMDLLGIDHRYVEKHPSRPCGICLSYVKDGERILLTHPGANFELANYIEQNLEEIAHYMVSARFIHVTSFLDERTPQKALELLTRVKELNPHTLISFDPGHSWATTPTPPVEGILQLSSYVFLNYREFKALGQYDHGESDESIATKLLERCNKRCIVLVPKRYDTVEMYQIADNRIAFQQFTQAPLQNEKVEIEDATGAGDAFAAGILAALASRRLQVELGAYLGMSLARHKLQHKAFEGHSEFPSLANGFLQSHDTSVKRRDLPRRVFIAHGKDPQWATLEQFLAEDCSLPVQTLDSAAMHDTAPTKFDQYLDTCSLAVCVLTAEEDMQEGSSRANDDIVHQAGIFQGKYGFGRVAMLVEEDCQTFSNVEGLIRFSFPHGHIDNTFWNLERMLRREGMLTRH